MPRPAFDIQYPLAPNCSFHGHDHSTVKENVSGENRTWIIPDRLVTIAHERFSAFFEKSCPNQVVGLLL